jgi:hypothetical protein
MRALEICAEASDGGIENDVERPPEPEQVATAILPAVDLDRRGPLEHQTTEARMEPGAHRHLLVSGRRRGDRDQPYENGQQQARSYGTAHFVPEVTEPNVSPAAHETHRECAASRYWEVPNQPPITRAIRSLSASALNGFTM